MRATTPALRTPPEPIAYGKVPGPQHRATRTGSKRQSRESELAAVDHAFDLGLRLGPVEAVFGDQLGHQLLLASQGADLDFGELVPLGTNVLAESRSGQGGLFIGPVGVRLLYACVGHQ